MSAFAVGPSIRDPQALRNPILDELDNAAQNAHAQLSPQAQAALAKAGAPIPGQTAGPAGPQPTITTPRSAPPAIAPAMPLAEGGMRGNAANGFNTSLAPGEEPQFQTWKNQYAPRDSGQDYDLQGAYKYGLTPDPQTGHWSDRFKKPNHSTFSVESQYAQDVPGKAGSWNGDTYVPPAGAKPTITSPRTPVTPVPQSPTQAGNAAELARLTAPPPSNPALVHTHANTGTAGVNQIHSPWARIPLQIASAIGETFAPRLAAALPGTESHHQMLVGERQGALKQDELQREWEEKAQAEAAKASQEGAQAHLQEATAQDIEREGKFPSGRQYVKVGADGLYDAEHKVWVREPSDPSEKGTVHQLEDGRLIIAHPDGRATEITLNGQSVKGQPKTTAEGELPLGDRVAQLNQAMTSRYQVLHPKAPLPSQYQIPANATQKDYDRIDKALEAEERAVGTKEQQAQTNELRRQTMALAAGNQQNRQETAVRTAAFKAYTPALDSAERFNVMAKNYEDAVKSHDQQAMLSLLANHLGMTMGLQKGSRLTKDIIHEAEVSRPWLQGMQAKFDKDGYLSGVNLTPQQMQQMVNLGRERFSQDVSKASSEARYQGANDNGPDRIPNRSTINHYTALANGDPAKAKQLAAEDGWTVK